MIKSFRCAETETIFNGVVSKRIDIRIQNTARRKLRMINNARTLDDLRIPPANRLEPLKGNRKGQYSIRINDQYRICFKWHEGNLFDVEIVDYH